MTKKFVKELKKGMNLSDIKDVFKSNFMKTKGVDTYLDLDIIKDVEGQYVYEIINNINGKKYIGRTKNIIRRVYEHIYHHTNQEFKQDLYKYGLTNFTFEYKISLDMVQEEIDLINKNSNLYNIKKHK